MNVGDSKDAFFYLNNYVRCADYAAYLAWAIALCISFVI